MEILNFLKKEDNPQKLLEKVQNNIKKLDNKIKERSSKRDKYKNEKGEVPLFFEVESFETILEWRINQIKEYFLKEGYENKEVFEFYRKPSRDDNIITGMSYYDNFFRDKLQFETTKQVKGEVKFLTQLEYFEKCAKARGQFSNYNITREFLAIEVNNIKRIDKLYQENDLYYGSKFPIGVIDFKDKTQEGRHRALLSYRYKIDKIPTLIIRENF